MGKVKSASYPLYKSAKALLSEVWEEVMAVDDLEAAKDPSVSSMLERLVRTGGVTYPFMLVTQLLGKATNGDVNALCIQESSPLEGAWDARSLASKVVYQWNTLVGRPFPGKNKDPYVNNPARFKNFGLEMEAQAGNPREYADLSSIVSRAQAGGQEEARRLLFLTLVEARRVLEDEKRDYFGPPRISATDVMDVLFAFLKERSNGTRLQVVTYAIYQALSEAFDAIGQVTSESTNAADSSSNRTGDVECSRGETPWLAIEVKDRTLTRSDVEATALKAKRNGVTNVIFVVQGKPLIDDPDAVEERIAHHFGRGVDLNVIAARDFFHSALLLLTAEQRAALLRKIHDALHEQRVHYKHVAAWMDLLHGL